MTAVRLLISIFVCIVIMAAGLVRAEDRKLTVFAAGSLREALGAIAEDFGAAHKIQIRTGFGPSGRMREHIERGEQADLFASAAIGHARTLVEQGRATVMVTFGQSACTHSGLTPADPVFYDLEVSKLIYPRCNAFEILRVRGSGRLQLSY
jgi:ABC-type molybdate transport system substrate-binding protein